MNLDARIDAREESGVERSKQYFGVGQKREELGDWMMSQGGKSRLESIRYLGRISPFVDNNGWIRASVSS